MKTKHAKSPVASASCPVPVREMSSLRVIQSMSWRIRELSSNAKPYSTRVVNNIIQ